MGKNKFTRFVTGLEKYGISVGGESLEEALQECVSIANRNNPGAGKWQLIKDAAGILWDVITDPESEYREQVFGSAKEGGKLAAMLGGGEILTNATLTNTVTNYKVGRIYGQDPQALIQEAQELNPNSALAKKLQERLDNGKKISGADLKKLVLENEKLIQAMPNETLTEMDETQTPTDSGNSWRNAAEYASQGDMNVIDSLNEAGLSGSAALAQADSATYADSFQKALNNGASYDQALKYAAADTTVGIVTEQIPMDVLLDSVEGDPKKAASAIDSALKQVGIEMTPGELNLLGIVAAEASAMQQDPAFSQRIAVERVKGLTNNEEAQTAASQALWQEATDRVITSEISDYVFSLDDGQGQLAEAVDTETGLKYDKKTDRRHGTMEKEKRIKVSYGGNIRWVLKEDIPKLQEQSRTVMQFFLEKGYPKEKVEEYFLFQILEE